MNQVFSKIKEELIALLPPTMTARAWLGIPFCAVALAGAGAAFLPIEHDEPGMIILGIAAIVLVCIMRIVQPRWSFVGAQLFVAVTTAAICPDHFAGGSVTA